MNNFLSKFSLYTKRTRYDRGKEQLKRFLLPFVTTTPRNSCSYDQKHQVNRDLHTHSHTKCPKLVIDFLADSVKTGDLIFDPNQQRAARRLSNLQKILNGYCNLPIIEMEQKKANEKGLESNARMSDIVCKETPDAGELTKYKRRATIPRGIFLFGEVGTGKTHLMDLFHREVSVAGSVNAGRKRRVHFHSFMQDIHQRIHLMKKKDLLDHGRNFSIDTSLERNPIHRVAEQLASEVSILCFDEFQVTDVADALILSQLFSVLFRSGTVVVATSNRHPSKLYEGGLNRSYFLPFIDLLCKYCIVHDMSSMTDYREVITDGIDTFFHISNTKQEKNEYQRILKAKWQNPKKQVEIKTAYNRSLRVREVHQNGQIARFRFDDLCNKELSSSDFRVIALQFCAVIIDDIPFLTMKDHNQARRFITLVDELYEANCALMCCAVAHPDSLFLGRNCSLEDKTNPNKDTIIEGIETEINESFGIDVAQSNGMTAGELASVQELSFAFRRASSRLKEMASKQFWEKQGIRL